VVPVRWLIRAERALDAYARQAISGAAFEADQLRAAREFLLDALLSASDAQSALPRKAERLSSLPAGDQLYLLERLWEALESSRVLSEIGPRLRETIFRIARASESVQTSPGLTVGRGEQFLLDLLDSGTNVDLRASAREAGFDLSNKVAPFLMVAQYGCSLPDVVIEKGWLRFDWNRPHSTTTGYLTPPRVAVLKNSDLALILMLGDAPAELVRGNTVVAGKETRLSEAGDSLRQLLHSASAARRARSSHLHWTELLVERALLGDASASDVLYTDYWRSLCALDFPAAETVIGMFRAGGSATHASYSLHVHPNTVRNRVRVVKDKTGLSMLEGSDFSLLRAAVVIGEERDASYERSGFPLFGSNA